MFLIRACRTPQLRRCRSFSLTSSVWSGHNRWSKIKHDKAREDASVNKQRSAIAEELRSASKQHGPDPRMNPRLASIIAAAKKQGFPKISIENAIARGQGVSPSGAALEHITIEAMIPPSIAIIVECQTDTKLRTLQDMRLLVKELGGSMTPTSHLFDRKGKIMFEKAEGIGEEDIFDQAIEAGAIDVDTGDGGQVVVFTEANQTVAVANAISRSAGLKIQSSDIIWDPKEDMMAGATTSEALDSFLDRLQEDSSVQEVYTNAS